MKKLVLGCLVACAVGYADLEEQGPRNAAPSGLLAGVARVDISPPIGIAHMNWGSATHIEADGIDRPGMFATALVLSDGRQHFAMIDIDALSVNGLEAAIDRAAEASGIPASNIRLAATHTHAGPMVSPERGPLNKDLSLHRQMMDRHRELVIDKLAGAVMAAKAALRPAHLFAGRGVGTININRRFRARDGNPPAVGRNPDGFVDRELVVIRIDDATGKPYAILANFQCHGTVLAYENRKISPDWIGMTRKVVEDAFPGAHCLFFQGAAGNQGPMEGFTGDLRVAHRLGATLGHQVAAVAWGVETVRREPVFEGFVESTAYQAKQHWRVQGPRDSTLRFAARIVELPRRTYTAAEIAGMESRIADAKEKVAAAAAGGDPWKQHQAGARVRRFENLLAKWKQPPDSAPAQVEVQLLRIGDVAIMSMPGEPFAEIGAALKKASPFAFTMFCGYSSGKGGDYLPVHDEYEHGGYEVERTPYGTGAAEKLIREASQLFEGAR